MLPEVQEYFDALEKMQKEYEEKCIANNEKIHERKISAETYRRIDDLLYNEYRAKLAELKSALTDEKNHTLVRWIAGNSNIRDRYWDYAERILSQLPATTDELHQYAKGHGWCEIWDEFKSQALADGVLDKSIRIEYKQNALEWQEFSRSIRMGDGKHLTNDDVMVWFKRGVKQFSISIRRSTYEFRLVDTKPLT